MCQVVWKARHIDPARLVCCSHGTVWGCIDEVIVIVDTWEYKYGRDGITSRTDRVHQCDKFSTLTRCNGANLFLAAGSNNFPRGLHCLATTLVYVENNLRRKFVFVHNRSQMVVELIDNSTVKHCRACQGCCLVLTDC